MIKKWSVFTIAIIFAACCFIQLQFEPAYADTYQDTEFHVEYTYSVTDDWTIDLQEIHVNEIYSETPVTIPNEIDGMVVSEVHLDYTNGAYLDFSNCKGLKLVDASECMQLDMNFTGCENLQNLAANINNTIVLDGCNNLQSLYLGLRNKVCPDFSSCQSLKRLVLKGDLSGITVSDWPASLKYIELTHNRKRSYDDQLPIMDFSTISNLRNLHLVGIGADVIKCNGLNELRGFTCNSYCSRNPFAYVRSIDLSGCSQLKSTVLKYLNLRKLNMNGCKALVNLDCSHNRLQTLDLRYCKNLTRLWCDYNCIESLNLKKTKHLTKLICNNNNLNKILLPANMILKGGCTHNFLKKDPSLKMIKHMGKKRVIPQDKIAKKSVAKIRMMIIQAKEDHINVSPITVKSGHVTCFQVQVKLKGTSKWKTYTRLPNPIITIKNLQPGETYYIRTRAQLKVDRKWFTGEWSYTETVDVEE